MCPLERTVPSTLSGLSCFSIFLKLAQKPTRALLFHKHLVCGLNNGTGGERFRDSSVTPDDKLVELAAHSLFFRHRTIFEHCLFETVNQGTERTERTFFYGLPFSNALIDIPSNNMLRPCISRKRSDLRFPILRSLCSAG